ncbi:Hypothetical predicted protein [Octopus vulgaris]|uniref:Uncharacterized protein n=1 Tax=Octopus vulgaris TaxID=6645 RepID=A0AA36AM58_OCTVU|nr:Hypothetical predicted protein [Octopus vulgaris]
MGADMVCLYRLYILLSYFDKHYHKISTKQKQKTKKKARNNTLSYKGEKTGHKQIILQNEYLEQTERNNEYLMEKEIISNSLTSILNDSYNNTCTKAYVLIRKNNKRCIKKKNNFVHFTNFI